MLKKIFSVLLMIMISVSFLMGGTAEAKWPKKPIRIIIPWPPTNDPSTMVTMAMVPLLSKEFGVPVKVIHYPGGSGVLGTNKVATSRPDGYTMGLISIGPMITQVLRGRTPYKNRDLKPLGMIWSSPFTLASRANAPYKNLKELAEYAKTHKIKLADWGLGAVPTLIALKAAQIGGFKFEGTAYRNLNPLLLVSGDADVITLSTPSLRDYIESGKIRLLAVMLPKRLPDYPNVPTVSQQGFGKAYSIWFGLFVPKRTPENRARRLREVFFKVMAMPKIQRIIRNVGVIYDPTSPEEARRQMNNELASFGAIMKKLGIIK